MCGITGILSPNPVNITDQRLKSMTGAIAHRGPDGENTWISESGLVGLGHRRLSIIDLSPAGAQPMHYLHRYTIVHNGEIYNYRELRDLLQSKGYTFSSRTDTEVILAAYDHFGTGCLQYFDGMFAFAIWDEKEKHPVKILETAGAEMVISCEDYFCVSTGRKGVTLRLQQVP